MLDTVMTRCNNSVIHNPTPYDFYIPCWNEGAVMVVQMHLVILTNKLTINQQILNNNNIFFISFPCIRKVTLQVKSMALCVF